MSTYRADMPISDILASHPDAPAVFERNGLPCAGCLGASIETLDAVAHVHGVSTAALLDQLNSLVFHDAEDED